jgi:hypothetical protein
VLKTRVRKLYYRLLPGNVGYPQYLQDNFRTRCGYPKCEGSCCADNIGSSHTL